ncbi:MAG: cupin domain-containing protein [Rubrivivax sp.]|nr:cupin domain-containing protein [Rubrivivax sp.]
MALPHAQPLDVISVRALGDALHTAVSTSLLRSDRVQLLHLVLPQHHDQPLHYVDDTCIVHCLEGQVEVVMPSSTRRLNPAELLVLPPSQNHGLRARTDCAVLVTLLRWEDVLTGGPAERAP